MILEITKNDFKEQVLDNDGFVLVDFWAPWCMPCQMLAPVLEELEKELEGVKIAKVNVSLPENKDLAIEYNIQSIPNLKLFKNGEIIAEFIGLQTKEELKKEIQEAVSKSL
ncbi:thioredoxin [bacterium]|nr:thioredoxin [bacterium]